MNSKDISTAKDPDLRGVYPALLRAAEMARQTAIQTDTAIIIVENNTIVRIPAAVLREQAKAKLTL